MTTVDSRILISPAIRRYACDSDDAIFCVRRLLTAAVSLILLFNCHVQCHDFKHTCMALDWLRTEIPADKMANDGVHQPLLDRRPGESHWAPTLLQRTGDIQNHWPLLSGSITIAGDHASKMVRFVLHAAMKGTAGVRNARADARTSRRIQTWFFCHNVKTIFAWSGDLPSALSRSNSTGISQLRRHFDRWLR